MTRGDGADGGVEEGRRLLEVLEVVVVVGPLLCPLWSAYNWGGGLGFLPSPQSCCVPDTFQAGRRVLIFLADFLQFFLFVICTENYQRVLTACCVGALPEFHVD